ncbi:MAG: lysine--tRNA ligase [Candidatus Nanoarchaeia archaeon]
MVDSDRLEKLKQIRKLGINPYPGKAFERTHLAKEIHNNFSKLENKKVSVAGRIMSIREHGALTFADLEDFSGKIQLWLSADNLGKSYGLLKLIERGDFLGVHGIVTKTKRGEISIKASDFTLLSKALRHLPVEWFGLKDVEQRYRQRYVDLIINKNVREIFLKRTQILREIRNFLDERGFVEVETPIIQSVYGGAAAKPFKTYINDLKMNAFLRISDELHLKRLIVGGFEKVYEVSKDFRNESIDAQHNPEFTQVEFYEAYADYEKMMQMTEELLVRILRKINNGNLKVKYGNINLDFTPPLPRIKFRDIVLKETGIDINKANTEKKLKTAIKQKRLKLDIKGVVGYGGLCDKLYKEYVRPKIIQPTFLLDYPVEMIPLAKRKDEDPTKIATMQLLANGFEIIKAYNELNDPIDQRERFEEEAKLAAKGLEEAHMLDEDFIRALEYGMPPTAGWGAGVDRLTMLLTNAPSIKEVILFPFMGPSEEEKHVHEKKSKK